MTTTVVETKLREIYLFGEITIELSKEIIQSIRLLSCSKGAIHLIINCHGGDEGSGWAIYDALKLCGSHTVAEVFGECKSMAMTVLQGCKLRLAAPEARFMMHNGSIEMIGNQSTFVTAAEESKFLTNRYHEVLAERSHLDVITVKNNCLSDFYFSTNEALDMGFIDGKIIDRPKLRKSK